MSFQRPGVVKQHKLFSNKNEMIYLEMKRFDKEFFITYEINKHQNPLHASITIH